VPTIAEMKNGFEPEYPSVGCKMCDRIRKLKCNPALRCLVHDETISEEERKRLGVRFETLVKGNHNPQGE